MIRRSFPLRSRPRPFAGLAGLAGFVAAVGLVLSACSQDVSIDEWLARADEVCRQEQASADADPAPASPLPGDELRHLAQQGRDQVERLRALDLPDAQRSSVSEYLLSLDHRIEVLRNYADEVDQAPAQGPAPDRSRLEDVTTEANTRAVALGLEVCGGGVDRGVITTTTAAVLSGGGVVVEPPSTAGGGDIFTPDGPG
jgi:hypothetical protein